MKKIKKLTIKKVTLLNLDDSKLDAMAGGTIATVCNNTCLCTKVGVTCRPPECIYSVDACAVQRR